MWPASSVATLSSWVDGLICGGDPLLLPPTPERLGRASACFRTNRVYSEPKPISISYFSRPQKLVQEVVCNSLDVC